MSVTSLDGRLQFAEQQWYVRGFGILVLFMLWTILASLFPFKLMPYPYQALDAVGTLFAKGAVVPNLIATSVRVFFGFLGALALGIGIGVFMGINNYGRKLFTPYVMFGLSIPGLAWAITMTLVFGFTLLAPVTTAVLIIYPYIAIQIWKGVENIRSELIEMAGAFNVSRLRTLYRVIIHNIAPELFTAFRYSFSLSWKIIPVAELFSTGSGVGYKLMQAYDFYNFEAVWAWIIIYIAVVLLVEYGLLQPLEKKVFAYRSDADFGLVGSGAGA
ncbi:MAG: ABC transporter permease [Halorhabdus sp.]